MAAEMRDCPSQPRYARASKVHFKQLVVYAQLKGAHSYADSFTGLVGLCAQLRPPILVEISSSITQAIKYDILRSRERPYFTSGAYRQVLIFLLKRLVLLPHPCIEIITPRSAQFMHLIDRVIICVSSDQIIMKDVARACSRLPGLLVTIRTAARSDRR